MRDNAIPVEVPRGEGRIVDIVGTGGDGQDTFNISTTAGMIAAAAGAKIVKHGNRAATSKSGAADILEALGAKLEIPAAGVPKVLEAGNFAFLFARSYHPAMRHVGPVRLELGIRTVFNILGPLTNPARPDGMVCGVFDPSLGRLFAEVFKMLGMKRALVVHGREVLDELSIEGPSKVWELNEDGNILVYEVTPSDFGVESFPLKEVASGTPEENVRELRELLAGRGRSAVREMVLMNASAALYVAGKASNFKEGVAMARAAITDGRATRSCEAYVAASQAS
jgi:anthranilate phosphoribosyltransferase